MGPQQTPLDKAYSVENKECFSERSTISAQGWHVGQDQVNAGEYHGFSSFTQLKPRDVGHSFIFIFETVRNYGRHCPGSSHKKSGTPCTAVHCIIPEKTKWERRSPVVQSRSPAPDIHTAHSSTSSGSSSKATFEVRPSLTLWLNISVTTLFLLFLIASIPLYHFMLPCSSYTSSHTILFMYFICGLPFLI